MDIHYIATKDKVVEELERYVAKAGYRLVPLDKIKPAKDIQYLLLVEPLNIEDDYYSVHPLWKHWLMRHAPDTKLLVAAFSASKRHSNFLPLLELPKSFGECMEKAVPVRNFPLFYRGTEERSLGIKEDQYADPWPMDMPQTGSPILPLLKKFINGHDKANSFFEQLVRLRKGMMDLEAVMDTGGKGDQAIYRQVTMEFDKLHNRWMYYKPLLDFAPFAAEVQAIAGHLHELGGCIRAEAWEGCSATPLLKPVEDIRDILKEKVIPIIHAEEHW